MADKKNAMIIIKRYDAEGGHAHHGGGWKVAYADFMTAMMAFFLLLWILAASDEEKLRGLANYFTPTVSDGGSSSDAAADLRPLMAAGVMTGAVDNTGNVQKPTFGRDNPMMVFDSRLRDKPAAVVVEYAEAPEPAAAADPATLAAIEESERRQSEIDRMAEDIAERITSDSALNDLARNVRLEKSNGALTVQVLDQDERSLFARGSADVTPKTRELLLAIGDVIADQNQPVEIVGHTDAAAFGANNGYTNWELSADRANATRRTLMAAGITGARFMRVSGVADTQPINTIDPLASENRRISIRLVYQAE
ncbi:flagellar motor protein MotB [Sulfitobacter sp. W074]|uniref:flagellar motor protein MotB n=1 Tax=Sulfitobacter sp. W074 TaxID=2867026 RepID=UPI0021A8213F|nr:flagellar motor protein MotB [Sulfitobacter sp. W074]UWR38230.1 OmpA family protein [Sulfitobacter sp. W074]